MLFIYQLKIADFYDIPIVNVKKLVFNFFDQKKYVLQSENWQPYLRQRLKLKKTHCVLEFNRSQCLKWHAKCSTKKRIAVLGKVMENVGNGIDVRLANSKKDYLK